MIGLTAFYFIGIHHRRMDFAEMTTEASLGFEADFLGSHIPLPRNIYQLVKVDHPHFTIFYSFGYKQPIMAVGTINMTEWVDAPKSRQYSFDPNLPNSVQRGNDWYRGDSFDRGHLLRRNTLSWGRLSKPAVFASDFFSNLVPQHQNFHRDEWDAVENVLFLTIIKEALKKSAIEVTGSFIDVKSQQFDDAIGLPHLGFRIVPNAYWKIVFYVNRRTKKMEEKGFWVPHNPQTWNRPNDIGDRYERLAKYRMNSTEIYEKVETMLETIHNFT